MIDIEKLDVRKLAKLIDHTLLKACAQEGELKKLCEESMTYGFGMVAVNSVQTAYCKKFLKNSPVHVGAAISFPLGQTTLETKIFETKQAIADGADEIDYVLNIGKLKQGDYAYIQDEMASIVGICRENHVISKVIFENCYLTRDEIVAAAAIANKVRPDFIKTSTGFGTGGARTEDVALMKEVVGDRVRIKAAGGIRSWDTCRAMLHAGAERIGTSASIAILEQYLSTGGKR
ncbi:MAG: deoxyribose-phosphate aldolase [Candidatus Onthomonas sp.]